MDIKIAYIGGGSKQWARIFMSDLALTKDLHGIVNLYDIDLIAAKRNQQISKYINENPKTLSKFDYVVCDNLDDALSGVDFVIISILPGTFDEMESDIHAPEKYGIYQSVGDSTGPGGILRAMRTVPIYEYFAEKIKNICPNAWVINFTNPMTICIKTLFDVFPKIKAFGCCHEVFHAQEFLCRVLKEIKDINVSRKEIYTDASGINHFTWFSEAYYKDIDVLSLIPAFKERFFDDGYYEYKGKRFDFLTDVFAYGNNVKMDLFEKYNALPAAGDRHIVEFLPLDWYLKDKQTVKKWKYNLTSVEFRKKQQQERIQESIKLANGTLKFELNKSNEEAIDLIKAILGYNEVISNVNTINVGQMSQLPLGCIVETNCIFKKDSIIPIKSKKLPEAVLDLIKINSDNIELCYKGIKKRDLNTIYQAFKNQPLCNKLNDNQSKELFKTMCLNTKKYLKDYYDLENYFN